MFECPVVDLALVLECHHVLFILVASTIDITQPVGFTSISTIKVIRLLSLLVNLIWECGPITGISNKADKVGHTVGAHASY